MPRYTEEQIEEVRSRSDIVQIIGQQLHRAVSFSQ